MIINHRFGNPGQLGETAQGQGVCTFLAHELPGDVQQLPQSIFPRHPATGLFFCFDG
ncbi:hypothetical protein D3C71_1833890 [compost metagenome]